MSKVHRKHPPEIAKDITQNIKSGVYFRDAVDWYAVKYIYPVVQRSFLIIVMTSSIITSFVALVILWGIFPINELVPLAVSVDNRIDSYSSLRYIGKKEDDSSESVLKYLTGRYIRMRETYEFNNLKNTIEYVRQYTDPADFQEYNNYMSTDSNPNSPILVYRNHTKRQIEVVDVVKLSAEESGVTTPNLYRMVASFRVTETGVAGKNISLWKARLDVHFGNIVFYKDTEKFSPLDFKVIDYQSTLVENVQ